ncbi:sugar transferase [Lactobacillus crispatus]|uniref:Glucosyltransferase 3 n=1 Tax=Lactobacillus crispatus TaxID=47770 RepID=A0A7H9E6M2_9LACO|nr:sugar transferase [Lactobacillus crispatus]QLL73254.1 beta-1,6-galactofuranosyltransferase [Lactobacillus crispatus]
MTVHITNLYGMDSHSVAQIAQNMVAKIGCQDLNFNELGIYMYNSENEPVNETNARFDGIIASVANGDTVIFQSPTWNTIKWDNQFIDHFKLYSGIKIIIFIEDIPPLMFDTNRYLLPQFIDFYNKADLLIVPSVKMLNFLKENGLKDKNYVVQKMWNHLSNIDCSIIPNNTHIINFTGNPDKFSFVTKWNNDDVKLQLFGKESNENNNPQVKYMGWQNDVILLNNLRKSGGWGLVWTEDPVTKEYMSMDATFKFSTYLAAGIPVIVHHSLQTSDLVAKKHLGIVVDNLEEASNIVKNISDSQYQEIIQNVNSFGTLIRNGYFVSVK